MRRALTTIAAVAFIVAACGGGDAAGVTIDGAWARTSPAMATAGAAYMNLTSSEDDELVSASVDSAVAATVEIHETVMADGTTTDESTTDESTSEDSMAEGMGEMMMQPVEAIELPAGETVSLEPGGFHIMMLDLADPLEVGDTFDLTLTFANAGEETVSVEVRDSAP